MYEKRRDILATIIPKVIKYSQVSIHWDLADTVYVYIATDLGHIINISIPMEKFLTEKPDVILYDIINQFTAKIVECYIDGSVYSVASTYLANKEVVEGLSE